MIGDIHSLHYSNMSNTIELLLGNSVILHQITSMLLDEIF